MLGVSTVADGRLPTVAEAALKSPGAIREINHYRSYGGSDAADNDGG
jgi:hypothetical protein